MSSARPPCSLPRPTTVWPLPHHDARTPLLPAWLHGALLKAGCLYTRPQGRVLLLAPPPSQAASSPGSAPCEEGRLLNGLADTAQTLARLDRPTTVRRAESVLPGSPGGGPSRVGPESGNGPAADSRRTAQSPHRLPDSATDSADPGPESVGLILALVDPTETAWVATVDWASLIRPDGALAFITHSDYRDGRLIDPGEALTEAVARSGYVMLDRIAVLEVPLRHGTPRLDRDVDLPPATAAEEPIGPRHVRVHSDLLLYIRPDLHPETGQSTAGGDQS